MSNRRHEVPSIETSPAVSGEQNHLPVLHEIPQKSAGEDPGSPSRDQGPASLNDCAHGTTMCQEASSNNREYHDLGVYEKFGSESVGLLILTSVSIVAAVSMLSVLWFVDHSNDVWKKIVLANWLPRTVTLCASVIRIAVAYQAALATSMLAAIVLSRRGPLLHLSAALSVMRFVNTGPRSLVPLCCRDMTLLSYKLWVTLAGFLCTTVITQFGSTILISDLHGDLIVGLKRETKTASGFKTTIPSWSPQPNYWETVPQMYPTFAESSRPGSIQDGIDDTGATLRSLLPLPAELSRELLRSFEGNATVIDSQVTCVRPTFGGENLTIQWNSDSITGQDNSYISGVVGPAVSVPGLIQQPRGSKWTPFKCGFMPTDSQFDDSIPWILSMCFLNASAGGLLSQLDPYHKPSMSYCWDSHNGWQLATDNGSCPIDRYGYTPNDQSSAVAFFTPPLVGSAYLVLNASRVSFAEFPQQNSSLWSFSDWKFDSNGSTLTASLSKPSIRFESTLCYDALTNFDLKVRAVSQSNRTEPYMRYDSITSNFTTDGVLSQLGANRSQTTSERGILQLQSEQRDLQDQVRSFYPLQVLGQAPTSFVVGRVSVGSNVKSALFCPRCQPMFDTLDNFTAVVNPQQASIFRDMWLRTGRPALAVQAHFTTLVRMAYYDNLPIFNYPGTQVVDSFLLASIPTTYKGYTTLMASLVLHGVLFGVTAFSFASGVHTTRLGNVWHTIAQLKSEQTGDILNEATMASDRDVRSWRLYGTATRRVRVRRSRAADLHDRVRILQA